MAAHVPVVRLKNPVHGRIAQSSRLLKRARATPHAVTKRIGREVLVRRGPTTLSESPTLDLAFKIAAAGVTIAAAVLGVALGLARPSWALAAVMIALGAGIAALVVFRSFSARGAVVSSS